MGCQRNGLPCDEFEKFYDSNTSAIYRTRRLRRRLRISEGTVSNYLSQAEGAGITHSVALGLDDAALLGRLYPQRYVYRQFAAPDFAHVHRELNKKGVTLQLLWEEYRESAQGIAYSRSRFC